MFTVKKCAQCGGNIGRLEVAYNCSNCGRTVCSKCIQKVSYKTGEIKEYYGVNHKRPEFSLTKMSNVLCAKCAKQFDANQNRLRKALNSSNNVDIVSKNYRGRKNSGTIIKRVSSRWYRDKNDCDRELQKLARIAGGSRVINVTTVTDTAEEPSNNSKHGIHKYTIFRREGDVVV